MHRAAVPEHRHSRTKTGLSGGDNIADHIVHHQYECQSWGMGELLIRGIGILMAICAAYQGGRQFLSGSILIKDTEDPRIWLKRRDRPVAFWTFVLFWYAIVFAVGYAAIFGAVNLRD
jgi:hypothetical protein